jgi:hypothetical protein
VEMAVREYPWMEEACFFREENFKLCQGGAGAWMC